MLLKGREGRRGREGANGSGARIAAARQSECVANTMHISHCSWPPPFFAQGKNDSAKHCSRLHSWVHQVQSGHVLAWLQSKQNWPFLRLYLPLILLHLFFLPGVSTASSPAEAAYSSVTKLKYPRGSWRPMVFSGPW